jgi:signal transduction histidine kinase
LACIREIESIVAGAEERTRTLMFRLSPPILHDLGLAAAAQWLAEDLERNFGLKIQVSDAGLPEPLGFEIREALFRSLREVLINVARHAKSAKSRVYIGGEGTRARSAWRTTESASIPARAPSPASGS